MSLGFLWTSSSAFSHCLSPWCLMVVYGVKKKPDHFYIDYKDGHEFKQIQSFYRVSIISRWIDWEVHVIESSDGSVGVTKTIYFAWLSLRFLSSEKGINFQNFNSASSKLSIGQKWENRDIFFSIYSALKWSCVILTLKHRKWKIKTKR